MGDEEDEASMGATRYPVMPSLVALQQMRNRLHLAQLGKKLMKWTALATGKELRRLSMEMSKLMVGYSLQWKTAFILLARSRYFVSDLNTIVLETVPKQASVSVTTTIRSVSGVRLKNMHLLESKVDNYQYTGLAQGGQVVNEAKEAWLELIRMNILLCQYRVTFIHIDLANKNATKKQNVLARCVIPRITITMRYILSELDEREREESFRLKRFKQLKYKNVGKEKKDKDEDEDGKPKKPAFEPEPEPKPKPAPQVKPEPEPQPKPKVKTEPEPEPKHLPKVEPKPQTLPKPEPIPEPTVVPELPKIASLDLLMNHIMEVVRLAEKLETEPIPPEKEKGLTICELGKLKDQLKKLIKVSKDPIKDRVCLHCGNIGKTASSCSCLMKLESPKQVQTGDFTIPKPEGYDAAMNLMPKSNLKTMIPKYILEPKQLKPKNSKDIDSKPMDLESMSKSRIEELEKHVDQVICMTNRYQGEGLLSKSAEDFLKCCQSVKIKIQKFQCQKIVKAKLDRLKEKVTNLEKITTIVQKNDLSATTVSSFMSCCKEFKAKIDRLKSCRGAPSVGSIEKLLTKIDYSIVLSKEAKDKGLVSESVEEFIKNCVEIKTKIEPHNEPKPQVIDDLLFNLNDIIDFITKYKDDALVSDSIETFYQNCKTIKAKLDSYKAGPPAGSGKCESVRDCPKTPPKTSSPCCPCKKTSSHTPSVNSCYAGASVPSKQGTTTTCDGRCADSQKSQHSDKLKSTQDSAPPPTSTKSTSRHKPTGSQQSQHSCKSKSTKDSAPPQPCTESTCPYKQSFRSKSLQSAPPKKSKSADMCNVCSVRSKTPSSTSVKVTIIPTEKTKKKDPKEGQTIVSTTKTLRTYKEIDGSIVEETKTVTVKQRVHDGQKPPSRTSSCGSCASTGRQRIHDGQKPPSRTSSCGSCASTGRQRVYDGQKPPSRTSSCGSCASTGRQRVHDGQKPPSRTSSCGSCASTGRQRVHDGQKPPSRTSSCGSCASGKSDKRINLCKIPVTKGFIQTVRNTKSETFIRSVDLSSPYPPFLWPCISADTLSSLERSNENETVEHDPFFCASPTTSDDDSVLPM